MAPDAVADWADLPAIHGTPAISLLLVKQHWDWYQTSMVHVPAGVLNPVEHALITNQRGSNEIKPTPEKELDEWTDNDDLYSLLFGGETTSSDGIRALHMLYRREARSAGPRLELLPDTPCFHYICYGMLEYE